MGTEYSIYEEPISAFPKLENPVLEKPTLEIPNSENQPQSSTYELNTEISNMQKLNIHQSITENKMMDTIDRNSVSQLLKDNISYDALAHDYTPERIDELVHIMTDAYCSTQPVLRIGNEDIPIAVVKSRIMKLNMEHIRYVLYALSQNKTKVHNIKSYLLTCLYNALQQYLIFIRQRYLTITIIRHRKFLNQTCRQAHNPRHKQSNIPSSKGGWNI